MDGDGGPYMAASSPIPGDFGSLISFENLENVMQNVIKKFKAIEAKSEATESTLASLRQEIDARATIESLKQIAGDTTSQLKAIVGTANVQKESIVALVSSVDQTGMACQSLERKLDASLKEKAVQDRLIRESQDALQDKVSVAELNMFEARLAGYATKLEHQEVISSLSYYARVDVADRIAENVRVLGSQFEDYSRTAKVERQLQEVRDWVTEELGSYAKKKLTTDKLTTMEAMIRDQSLGFERVNTAADDKIRGLSDRLTSIYAELNADIGERAMAEDLRETRMGLKAYALKAETSAFQQDCIPKLKFCVDSIKAFDERLRAQDDAIHRVDDVLLDKAAKYDIVVMNGRVEQCMPRDVATQELQQMRFELQRLRQQLDSYVEGERHRMDQIKPLDIGPLVDELNNSLRMKADKADLVEIYQLKANRIDCDELTKLQGTLHHQLEYLAVTAFGLAKLSLTEAKQGESKTIRTQQKSQVLMQSEALWHWIMHNEAPPNLDTLRPPPSARGRVADHSPDSAADQQKRLMDHASRQQLEKKLGLSTGLPAI